jgi:hypothetical protein
MDKSGCQPLHTAVLNGDPFPASPANVSLLSLLVLSPAPGLLSGSPQGGAAMTNLPGSPVASVLRDRGSSPAAAPTLRCGTNTYCATCLRTRRFLDLSTHLACETCARRLDKVAVPRRNAG